MNERLLLRLPHRQIVFTPRSGRCTDFPKMLRAFFRHDHDLVGEVSKLAYRMMQDFYPHLHGIFLEGGFDPKGRFVHVP